MVWLNFSKYEKMATSTTFSAPFLRSLLPPDTKIFRPRIFLRVKNSLHWQPILYILSNLCRWIIHAWRSWLHCIIITCGRHPLPLHYHRNCIYRRPHYFCLRHLQCPSEYHFTQPCRKSIYQFTLSISGLVQNKMAKTSIILKKSEGIMHSGENSIQGTKPDGKLWYDLLKSIFVTVKIAGRSSDHSVFWLVYKNYKSSLSIETNDILLATENIYIFFEGLTQ